MCSSVLVTTTKSTDIDLFAPAIEHNDVSSDDQWIYFHVEDLQQDDDLLEFARVDRLWDALSEFMNDHAERSSLEKELDVPIRRLPVEILREIFWFSVQDEYPGQPGFLKQALRLSQVCQLWRNIVTSWPNLWADGQWVITGGYWHTLCPGYAKVLSHYLKMSSPVPLTLEITERPSSTVYALLLQNSHRWRSAFIDDDVLKKIRGSEEMNFAELGSLDVRLGSRKSLEDSHWCTSATKIRSLTAGRTLPGPPFPYSNLESLTFGPFVWHSVSDWKILSSCLRLKKLFLIFSSLKKHDGLLPVSSPILFPTITFFQVDLGVYADAAALPMVFRIVTLPVLQRLHLIAGGGFQAERLEEFDSFISRSSCSLLELCLDRITLSDGGLREVFRTVPTLLDLTLRVVPRNIAETEYAGILNLLSIPISDRCGSLVSTKEILLPRLQNLEMYLLGLNPTILKWVSAMVASRHQKSRDLSVASLKTFNLLTVANDSLKKLPLLPVLKAEHDAGLVGGVTLFESC